MLARNVGDRTITLSWDGADLVDEETGTTWDLETGFGLDGELSEQSLALLPALTSFPGDFRSFWPEGEIWSPSAARQSD